MPEIDSRPPILAEAEADRRRGLLAELQDALAARSIQSVLASRRRLVLRALDPWGPSGRTDPQLHIFIPGQPDIATTDGTSYSLSNGAKHAADDPVRAADAITHTQPASARA